MRTFIVHAHHEPASFNGAMTKTAAAVLAAAGHELIVSDLYAMGFDPVSDRRNFLTTRNPDYLKQQDEEAHASAVDGYAPDVQAEMDKLQWCEALILQFPLWWLGMPAIMKGWVDRVFALGRAYGGGRYFDQGVFRGKRAMCSITVGGPAAAYSDIGIYGPMGSILFPIHHGILGFAGFTVVEPFIVHAPARLGDGERNAQLAHYRQRLLNLAAAPTLAATPSANYEGLVLKPSLRAAAA